MRVYICAKYACVYMRKVCVRIYAHSMRILCAYMRAYFAHTFAHTLRILCAYMRAYFARILCAYFAHICAHTLRIYARIVCAYMRAYLIFFWRIRTHTWRTDTAGMRAYLVCVETLLLRLSDEYIENRVCVRFPVLTGTTNDYRISLHRK